MNTYDAITSIRSVRHYEDRAIPELTIQKLLNAMRAAPSAKNRQPWKFVVIKNRMTIQQLGRKAVCKYEFFQRAPVVIAACGYRDKAFNKQGGYRNSVDVDVAIAVTNLTLSAWEEAIGSCWIGEFDEAEAKKILGVPEDVEVIVMVTMGIPADTSVFEKAKSSRRKDLAEIVSYEEYGGSAQSGAGEQA